MTFRPPKNLDELLPFVYRKRDEERGRPLQALLRVIGEQVGVLEDNIDQLYDNWFIETCEDWAVPYIADLIGYRAVPAAGEPGDVSSFEGRQRNRALVPRREVASSIALRRRKGTLAVLEILAYDIAAWPARAVEFYTLLGMTQPLRHLRLERGRTADLRDGDALDRRGGPFEEIAHNIDVHRISSPLGAGRHNLPNVGLFVWRLRAFSVTRTAAYCHESAGRAVGQSNFTFSILGNDVPLFTRAAREEDPTTIAGELNVPAPIRRRGLERDVAAYYGEGKSFAIWADGELISSDRIVAADLTSWHYRASGKLVAVDPELGRIAFPSGQSPRGVLVYYHYGFSAAIGGGEYPRPLPEPAEHLSIYRVCSDRSGEHTKISHGSVGEALRAWHRDRPRAAIIEIMDSAVYSEAVSIKLQADQSLTLRAANRTRPVIRLLDLVPNATDAMSITGEKGSSFTLDGLLIMGRGLTVRGPLARVTIRHSTLVPGWDLLSESCKKRPIEPSLILRDVEGRVVIAETITGPIVLEAKGEPDSISIEDSILDAGGGAYSALCGLQESFARAVLTMRRCTVFGLIVVHAIELAENSIFQGQIRVARRQTGCVRFSYVPLESRTPRRHHCQPDLAVAAARGEHGHKRGAHHGEEELEEPALALAALAVQPLWNSIVYGSPAYAQLADGCPQEILRGADDESEMGVFHDLFAPQREANLRTRLEEFIPAGSDAAVIHAT